MKKNVEFSEEKALEELKKGYKKAEQTLQREDKIQRLLSDIERKLKTIPKIGNKLAYVPIFASLLNDFFKKRYNHVPTGTIIAIISALTYFVSPIDLSSDIIPGVGLLDDAGVIMACLTLVKDDIDEYIVWRNENNTGNNDNTDNTSANTIILEAENN